MYSNPKACPRYRKVFHMAMFSSRLWLRCSPGGLGTPLGRILGGRPRCENTGNLLAEIVIISARRNPVFYEAVSRRKESVLAPQGCLPDTLRSFIWSCLPPGSSSDALQGGSMARMAYIPQNDDRAGWVPISPPVADGRILLGSLETHTPRRMKVLRT